VSSRGRMHNMAERRSTAVAIKSAEKAPRQTLTQRGAEATRSLRQAVQLPINPQDTTVLGTALAEVAAREARRNPQFASEIRQVYTELLGLKGKAKNTKKVLPPLVALHPDPNYRIDPFVPPDPGFLMRVYGPDQLDRALQDYTLDMLKRASALIEAAHPGTKPTNRSSKQSVIDYIVKYS